MPALIRKLHAAQKKLAGQDGLTLVEVIVAFFVIALVTGLVIHSSMLAINTTQINKTKTLALALINEQIEHMRAMDYDQLGIEGADPQGVFPPETEIDGFQVQYNIHWADANQSYKQVWVSAYREPMLDKLEAITMVYPTHAAASNGQQAESHPPPQNLTLTVSNGSVLLEWDSPPDTDLTINEYRVYRDGVFVGVAPNTAFEDTVEENQTHSYYVTAMYNTTESEPSNEVFYGQTTEDYPPPENLLIAVIDGEGAQRTVTLTWDAPVSDKPITEYRVYGDGEHIATTGQEETSYEDYPGTENTVTYYVRALYENEVLSEPSNAESG